MKIYQEIKLPEAQNYVPKNIPNKKRHLFFLRSVGPDPILQISGNLGDVIMNEMLKF